MAEHLILVDENDKQIGIEEKLKAHKEGLLHRALSIYIFNSKGELMLQQRAKGKYHSALLWTNTTCGHPRPEEKTTDAAKRRLKEEMGIETPLKEATQLIYKADLGEGLGEHEYLHVFIGRYDENPSPNPEEAESWKWIGIPKLLRDIKDLPHNYTYWLKFTLEKMGKEGILDDVLAQKAGEG